MPALGEGVALKQVVVRLLDHNVVVAVLEGVVDDLQVAALDQLEPTGGPGGGGLGEVVAADHAVLATLNPPPALHVGDRQLLHADVGAVDDIERRFAQPGDGHLLLAVALEGHRLARDAGAGRDQLLLVGPATDRDRVTSLGGASAALEVDVGCGRTAAAGPTGWSVGAGAVLGESPIHVEGGAVRRARHEQHDGQQSGSKHGLDLISGWSPGECSTHLRRASPLTKSRLPPYPRLLGGNDEDCGTSAAGARRAHRLTHRARARPQAVDRQASLRDGDAVLQHRQLRGSVGGVSEGPQALFDPRDAVQHRPLLRGAGAAREGRTTL